MFKLITINKHSFEIINLSSSADFKFLESRMNIILKYKKYLKHCPRTYRERMNTKNIEIKLLKELHRFECNDNYLFGKLYNHYIGIIDASNNKIFSNIRFLNIESCFIPFTECEEFLKEKEYVKREILSDWQDLKPTLKYYNI